MRFAAFIAILLLAGCSAPDTGAGQESPNTAEGPDAEVAEPVPLQRASIDWTIPISLLCAEGRYIDRVDGITHAHSVIGALDMEVAIVKGNGISVHFESVCCDFFGNLDNFFLS